MFVREHTQLCQRSAMERSEVTYRTIEDADEEREMNPIIKLVEVELNWLCSDCAKYVVHSHLVHPIVRFTVFTRTYRVTQLFAPQINAAGNQRRFVTSGLRCAGHRYNHQYERKVFHFQLPCSLTGRPLLKKPT